MEFVEKDYAPSEDDLICLFRVEPNSENSFERACDHIAKESSVGTWTHLGTLNERAKRIKARAYKLNDPYVEVAYPSELFELSNIPQVMSSIAGNIFGMKAIDNLRLVDVKFPKKMIEEYAGPRYGIEGVRKTMEVPERPLVGTIVKPKLGLDAKSHAKVAEESWIGGCDVVKDDENLTSQPFNIYEDRLAATLESRDIAEEETGEKKVYMCNTTAGSSEMMERAELIKEMGGRYMMIDVLTTGFSAVQEMRENGPDLIMHAHRAMHGALTRNKKHGITMLALAKLYRLMGVDQLHVGTAVGKMEGGKEEVRMIAENVEKMKIKSRDETKELGQEWHHIKPVFAVSSGGLHPGHVDPLMEFMGNDVIIQSGGGVHGHPDGSKAGARAMRQVVDAKMKGIDPWDYAEDHIELKKALDLWGTS